MSTWLNARVWRLPPRAAVNAVRCGSAQNPSSQTPMSAIVACAKRLRAISSWRSSVCRVTISPGHGADLRNLPVQRMSDEDFAAVAERRFPLSMTKLVMFRSRSEPLMTRQKSSWLSSLGWRAGSRKSSSSHTCETMVRPKMTMPRALWRSKPAIVNTRTGILHHGPDQGSPVPPALLYRSLLAPCAACGAFDRCSRPSRIGIPQTVRSGHEAQQIVGCFAGLRGRPHDRPVVLAKHFQ